MTYQSYLDGHILLSQQFINDLPVIISALAQSILIPFLELLICIYIWQKYVTDRVNKPYQVDYKKYQGKDWDDFWDKIDKL